MKFTNNLNYISQFFKPATHASTPGFDIEVESESRPKLQGAPGTIVIGLGPQQTSPV